MSEVCENLEIYTVTYLSSIDFSHKYLKISKKTSCTVSAIHDNFMKAQKHSLQKFLQEKKGLVKYKSAFSEHPDLIAQAWGK